MAHGSFGITTTISLNPSMVIGGLAIGVTPLDMAHAYQTIANDGRLTIGNAGLRHLRRRRPRETRRQYAWEDERRPRDCPGPVGITSIIPPKGTVDDRRHEHHTIPVPGFSDARSGDEKMMQGCYDRHRAGAQIPGVSAWGKTGTTSNYTDAWFVGSTPKDGKAPSMTVAVWVGYPNSDKSMAKDYGGKPVYGGTYPALIWKAYVEAALRYYNTGSTGITQLDAALDADVHPSVGQHRRHLERSPSRPRRSPPGRAGPRRPARRLPRAGRRRAAHGRRRAPSPAAAGSTSTHARDDATARDAVHDDLARRPARAPAAASSPPAAAADPDAQRRET